MAAIQNRQKATTWFPLLLFALKKEKRDVDRQGDEAKAVYFMEVTGTEGVVRKRVISKHLSGSAFLH